MLCSTCNKAKKQNKVCPHKMIRAKELADVMDQQIISSDGISYEAAVHVSMIDMDW